MNEKQQALEKALQKLLKEINQAMFGFYTYTDENTIHSMRCMIVANDYSKLHEIMFSIGMGDPRLRNIFVQVGESLKQNHDTYKVFTN